MINQKEIESVLKLNGQQRYNYFIKKVTDLEKVYGLFDNGWALVSHGEKSAFPLWSHMEYAELCINNEWSNYKVKEISLFDTINELLTNLEKDNINVVVFQTPNQKGVSIEAKRIKDILLSFIVQM